MDHDNPRTASNTGTRDQNQTVDTSGGSTSIVSDPGPNISDIYQRLKEELEVAARRGNINLLYTLIRRDPYLLDRIDHIPFVDTPMHIAAYADNASFTMEMMRLKPSFAGKQNQDGFTPMHLALQKWRTRILRRLVDTDSDLVRVKGREGETLLHYAVENGEDQRRTCELLDYLLSACPQSIEDVTIHRDTVLHIAVKRKRFDIFELLVKRILRAKHKNSDIQEREILNGKNGEGNTALHIAALKNEPKIVRVLIACGVDVNAKNSKGETALNISERQDPSEVGNSETRNMLQRASKASSVPTSTSPVDEDLSPTVSTIGRWKISINRYNANVTDDVRNVLLVVAVLIAMTAYHSAALSSVSQQNQATTAAAAITCDPGVTPGMTGGGSALPVGFWISNIGALLTTSLVIYSLLPGGYISMLLLLSLCLCSLNCYMLSPMSIVLPGISVIASIGMLLVNALWNVFVENATEKLIERVFS